jgi:hypothetical protein
VPSVRTAKISRHLASEPAIGKPSVGRLALSCQSAVRSCQTSQRSVDVIEEGIGQARWTVTWSYSLPSLTVDLGHNTGVLGPEFAVVSGAYLGCIERFGETH